MIVLIDVLPQQHPYVFSFLDYQVPSYHLEVMHTTLYLITIMVLIIVTVIIMIMIVILFSLIIDNNDNVIDDDNVGNVDDSDGKDILL